MATPAHPHFLIAFDRSPATLPHLSYAARLGNALQARLTLFHAVRPVPLIVNPALDDSGAPAVEDPDEARQDLQALASTLRSDRPVHVDIEPQLADRDAILAAAERTKADLIVMPTHGRTGIRRAVLGSVAEQVLRRSQTPVLLLTDHMLAHERTAPNEHGPILLATDLSPESRLAHQPAAELASQLGMPLQLISIVSDIAPPPHGGGAPTEPDPTDAKVRIEGRTRELRDAAATLSTTAPVDVDVRIAHDPAREIAAAATAKDAALLVLATHGRRGIARMLQGSVAEQVVRHSTVPVLVMPTAVG